MNISFLTNQDISPVDQLMLRADGTLNVVPAGELKRFPVEMIQLWCVKRGVYQLPTTELIEWLRDKIAGRTALEICSGNGAIGRALGIRKTHSYMQTVPEMANYYRLLGQEPISPPADVIEMTANDAVFEFKPEVVIGAWVTQLFEPGDDNGSVMGVDELAIIKVADYIHVGNYKTHGDKRSFALRHQSYKYDWLVSRGQDQSLNMIAEFNRTKGKI